MLLRNIDIKRKLKTTHKEKGAIIYTNDRFTMGPACVYIYIYIYIERERDLCIHT